LLPRKSRLGKENALALKTEKVHFLPPDEFGVLYSADASRGDLPIVTNFVYLGWNAISPKPYAGRQDQQYESGH
jgi:hypothetical protein